MRAATRAFSAWFVMPWLSAAIASSGAAVAAPEAPEERVRERRLDKEEARSRLKEKGVTNEQIKAVHKEFEPKLPPRGKRSTLEQIKPTSSKTGLAPLKNDRPDRVRFPPEGAEIPGQRPKEHHDHHHHHKEQHRDVCDGTRSAGEAERCEKAREARETFEPGGGKTGPRKE